MRHEDILDRLRQAEVYLEMAGTENYYGRSSAFELIMAVKNVVEYLKVKEKTNGLS